MYETLYYRSDVDIAWRFISLRSGQPAASERSLPGGAAVCTTLRVIDRTPR